MDTFKTYHYSHRARHRTPTPKVKTPEDDTDSSPDPAIPAAASRTENMTEHVTDPSPEQVTQNVSLQT